MNLIKSINLKNQNLSNMCLFSTPFVNCSYFGKSVVYIVSHTKDKAFGFTINKPLGKISEQILRKKFTNLPKDIPLYSGGPVNNNLITILHSNDYKTENSIKTSASLTLSNNEQIITDITNNKGPKHYIIAQGCSTWSKGQIEDEIKKGSWIISDFKHSYLKNNKKIWYEFYSNNNLPTANPSFLLDLFID